MIVPLITQRLLEVEPASLVNDLQSSIVLLLLLPSDGRGMLQLGLSGLGNGVSSQNQAVALRTMLIFDDMPELGVLSAADTDLDRGRCRLGTKNSTVARGPWQTFSAS